MRKEEFTLLMYTFEWDISDLGDQISYICYARNSARAACARLTPFFRLALPFGTLLPLNIDLIICSSFICGPPAKPAHQPEPCVSYHQCKCPDICHRLYSTRSMIAIPRSTNKRTRTLITPSNAQTGVQEISCFLNGELHLSPSCLQLIVNESDYITYITEVLYSGRTLTHT